MKAQTFIHKTDETFCVALSPGFMGLKAGCDPDGSAKLPGQGPVRLTKYWPEVKQYMVTALPQPQRGAETELIIIGDDLLCLGATRTPVANIGLLVRETHSFDPDKVVARRYATLEDIADLTEITVNRYKLNIPGASGPDGSATVIPQLGMYPGSIVVVLGGYQFIRPTPDGDEFEVIPFSERDAEALRHIAAALAFCRSCCVLLPPLASKFGLDPIFDQNTAQMAQILTHQGIMYYQPDMWNQMQLYDNFYPLDTVTNRRLYTRLFQCLLRLMEWYAAVRDKYCANDMLMASDTEEITCMFMPHNRDPEQFTVPTAWRKADAQAEKNRQRGIKTAMPTATEIQWSMGADPEKAQQLYKEFADYAAQRLAQHDKRDREHLDTIGADVERSMARNRVQKVEQNDFVYISTRAPPHFMSRTMYSTAEKKARLKEMLTDNAVHNKRIREILRTTKKLSKQKGSVCG